MSMLTAQCDNLRLMARLVREYDYSEISRMLREAADTIESLREKAQAAILGNGECEPKWTLQGETQTQEFWRCECGNCGECFGVESRESFPFKMTIDKVEIPNFCPNCGKAVKR